MRNTLAIAKKELTVYFTTPWAWVVFTAMTLISSVFFLALMLNFKQVHDTVRHSATGWANAPPEYLEYRNLTDGVVVGLWGVVLVVTLFVAPFLSMRLFAEERRNKTFELLMTTPTRSIEIVFGKYLGALGIIACTLGITIVYPVILMVVGSTHNGPVLDWNTVWLGWGALLLWGAVNMAIGLFVSSLTESQMVAALVSFAIAIAWMLVKTVAPAVDEPVRSILNYLSFDAQLQNLLKGVLELKPLVFFTSVIAFFLLLTHRSIEAQRWV